MERHFKKYNLYFTALLVLVFSVILAKVFESNKVFELLLSIPIVGSLVSVLYKIWLDNLAYGRAKELQNKQQDFILGTASHMAEVAYNKHVAFCEEYIERIEKGRQELFRDGPSRNCLNIGRELVNIRQRHSTWLTKEIEEKLKPFEQALIEIGAKEGLIDNLPIGEQRNVVIKHVYKTFGLVLGHETALGEKEADLKIDQVIEKIRDILGINILTKMRLSATDIAFKRLNN